MKIHKFHGISWFLWFFMNSAVSMIFGSPGGGPGGPKGGPPKGPPPHFGVHFPLEWPKYHWVYKQKWKGEIPAWGPWIRLFIFPYKPNGILVILIKSRGYLLRSYNNRGPPAGPGRGPVWGPSRGFRFSRSSQNSCIFWKFQEFLWIPGIPWKFQFSLKPELPSPPMRKRWYS